MLSPVYHSEKRTATINTRLNVEIVEQVTSFSYLGRVLTDDGRSETKIKEKLGVAKNRFNKININI